MQENELPFRTANVWIKAKEEASASSCKLQQWILTWKYLRIRLIWLKEIMLFEMSNSLEKMSARTYRLCCWIISNGRTIVPWARQRYCIWFLFQRFNTSTNFWNYLSVNFKLLHHIIIAYEQKPYSAHHRPKNIYVPKNKIQLYFQIFSPFNMQFACMIRAYNPFVDTYTSI